MEMPKTKRILPWRMISGPRKIVGRAPARHNAALVYAAPARHPPALSPALRPRDRTPICKGGGPERSINESLERGGKPMFYLSLALSAGTGDRTRLHPVG